MSEIFKRILVGLSGSESSQAAAGLAFRLARLHGAEVVLLTVVDTGLAQKIAGALGRPLDKVLSEMEVSGRSYLKNGQMMARRMRISVEAVLRRGSPCQEIVAEAESRQADLVVLGSTHVEGAGRLAIGRVVERVIQLAECPVLIVRHRAGRGAAPGS